MDLGCGRGFSAVAVFLVFLCHACRQNMICYMVRLCFWAKKACSLHASAAGQRFRQGNSIITDVISITNMQQQQQSDYHGCDSYEAVEASFDAENRHLATDLQKSKSSNVNTGKKFNPFTADRVKALHFATPVSYTHLTLPTILRV